MENTVFLIGASGHGKVVAEILEESGINSIIFLDDNLVTPQILEYSLIGSYKKELIKNGDSFIVTIGNNVIRKSVATKLNENFMNAFHPRSIISRRAFFGRGTVIMGGVTVNVGVEIGNHVIINTNASIDHNCIIEDYVHISPNVALAGDVHVGEGTHIGIGACVIQGVKIGKWCMIGAGTVVLKDVPDGATLVGNPGRVIKLI